MPDGSALEKRALAAAQSQKTAAAVAMATAAGGDEVVVDGREVESASSDSDSSDVNTSLIPAIVSIV